jgi:two-component system chemotaxis response regulator CheY
LGKDELATSFVSRLADLYRKFNCAALQGRTAVDDRRPDSSEIVHLKNKKETKPVPLDVLIVDDSAAIRKILLRVLSQTDLPIGQVIEASDGVEALKALQGASVGLILSDINMPNMDGLQLLTKLQESPEWKKVPVIMITTEGSQAKVLEAVQLGAKGYVRKPFTAEQIKEKVSTCLQEGLHSVGL